MRPRLAGTFFEVPRNDNKAFLNPEARVPCVKITIEITLPRRVSK